MSNNDSAEKRSFIDLLLEFSIPLIAGVLIALVWANVNYSSYEHFLHWSPFGEHSPYNFHFLIQDIFMVFFFGIATKEITESCLPGGDLNPVSKAINPIMGTLGGVFGPIGIYFLYVYITGDNELARGWAIPTATDIALAWLVARVVFGKGHPAISFLLLLAIADDGIGLGIIAVFYPDPSHPVEPIYLVFVVLGMVIAAFLRRSEAQTFWPYIIFAGTASWFGLYLAHLHPALTLVPIIPFLPGEKEDEGLFAEEGSKIEHNDLLNSFEHSFKTPVEAGLLGFGLANAGVPMSSIGSATWAVFLALGIGKTVGVCVFSSIGILIGFPLPTGMNLRSLFVAGTIAAIGMTVALFVADVAFTDKTIQGAAKMGALFSSAMAVVAIVAGKMLRIKKSNEEENSGVCE